MAMLHTKPSFTCTSQLKLSAHNSPATPPYTPAKAKRPFDKSDSPASSIHPTETSSPAKKVLKRTASDGVLVVELPDNDSGSLVGVSAVSPAELEEAEDYLSESQSELDDSEHDSEPESDSGISERFSKLNCDEQEEELEMTQKRLQRKLGKRTSLRMFKRLHSQTTNSDNEDADADERNDRSGGASIRSVRRRMLSPVPNGDPIDWEEAMSSPEPSSASRSFEQEVGQDGSGSGSTQRTYASVLKSGIDHVIEA
jgi:hypothetical protein